MDLDDVIDKRRSYRALDWIDVTDEMIWTMMGAASLSPSCSNKQPWRFIFVKEEKALERVLDSLSGGNSWARKGSMIIAVATSDTFDCDVNGIRYAQFDTGMATALLLLKATDLGLVTHPMAGFDKEKAKEALGLDDDMDLIALIAVGRKSSDLSGLKDWQKDSEMVRNQRKDLAEMGSIDSYSD